MPPRKKPVEPTPPPAPGHNTPELTDDALIAENFKLEDHVKAESEKFAGFLTDMAALGDRLILMLCKLVLDESQNSVRSSSTM